MSNGTSKPRRAMQLGATLIAVAGLLVTLTALASAQSTTSTFYSGNITGPDFCTNRSLGGPITYAFDSDDDGVADTCSLPRTRRATAARQNAMERLAGEPTLTLAFSILFSEECLKVAETFGEPAKEATDECAAPRAAVAAGRTPPAVPASPFPLDNTSVTFFSGPVVTSRTFCLNRSFGGPVTYPYDSNGDGVADICSLPRTRRAAVARQNAFERLAATQTDLFLQLFAEECRRVPATFGEPIKEARDECATGPAPTGTPLPTPGSGTGGTGTPGRGTTSPVINPPRSPVATNPGNYNKRAAQNVQLDPSNGGITVSWDEVSGDDNPNDNDNDPYDRDAVYEYEVWWTPKGQSWSSNNRRFTSDRTYLITGLSNFTTYNVRVKASRGLSNDPYTPTLTSTPGIPGPPVWPSENALTSPFYGRIVADWNEPHGSADDGITSYRVQWGTSSSNWSSIRQATVTDTQYTITGLSGGTHYVRVQGVSPNGPGTWSLTNSIRLTSTRPTPGKPTGLILNTSGTGTTLTATWTAPSLASPDPTHYQVQWRNCGPTGRSCESWSSSLRERVVQAPAVTDDIPNLTGRNQYDVRVRAVNLDIVGSWSSVARITLGQAAAPDNIKLDPGDHDITVTWDTVTSVPAVNSYNLQWSTSNSFSNATQVSKNQGEATHTISGLTDFNRRYVRIQSINSNGPGDWSPTVSLSPGTLDAPTGVSASEVSDHIRKLTVSWTSATETGKSTLTGFRIQRRSGNQSWNNTTVGLSNSGLTKSGDNYSYTFSNLTTGTAYEFQVLARNSRGDGPWSASTSATRPGASFIPSTGSLSSTTDDSNRATIQVSWSAPSSSITVTNYTTQWRTCGTTGYSCGGWGSSNTTTDTSSKYSATSLRSGVYYQARVRANGSGTNGGSGAYAESGKFLVTIDNNNTPNNRTDDTITLTELT